MSILESPSIASRPPAEEECRILAPGTPDGRSVRSLSADLDAMADDVFTPEEKSAQKSYGWMAKIVSEISKCGGPVQYAAAVQL